MITNVILPILFLLIIYAGLIAAIVWLVGRLPWLAHWRFLAGVLIFGLSTSLLAVWVWPLDSAVYPNLFSVLVGDWIYQQAASWFGAADPAQAHFAVPWPLRLPQIYFTLSLPLYGLLGLLCHAIYRWRIARRR